MREPLPPDYGSNIRVPRSLSFPARETLPPEAHLTRGSVFLTSDESNPLLARIHSHRTRNTTPPPLANSRALAMLRDVLVMPDHTTLVPSV